MTERATWSAEGLTADEATWALAKFMRDTMELYDPTGSPPWDELPPSDREFYRDVVRAMLDMRPLIERAWS